VKLEIAGMDFAYDRKLVLKNVNLKVKEGEFLTIIGPNASGKTTLLKCINNILKPKKGTIKVDGNDINHIGMDGVARKIGYVPQMSNRAFPTTVFDTVLMGRRPHGNWKPSDSDYRLVSEYMEKLDLQDIALREIGELSGGQRQKVMIARALVQEPDILLLDEPTSSLDLKHQLEVMEMVDKQTENGLTVVMTMHDLNLALRFSEKIIMLRQGKIFAYGGAEVLDPVNIEKVFGVKVSMAHGSCGPVIVPESCVI